LNATRDSQTTPSYQIYATTTRDGVLLSRKISLLRSLTSRNDGSATSSPEVRALLSDLAHRVISTHSIADLHIVEEQAGPEFFVHERLKGIGAVHGKQHLTLVSSSLKENAIMNSSHAQQAFSFKKKQVPPETATSTASSSEPIATTTVDITATTTIDMGGTNATTTATTTIDVNTSSSTPSGAAPDTLNPPADTHSSTTPATNPPASDVPQQEEQHVIPPPPSDTPPVTDVI
jgi:hypothetical protein